MECRFCSSERPCLATLGNRRGGGGSLRAYYSLVDVIGVLRRCAGRPRPRPFPAANQAYRDKAPWWAQASGSPPFTGAPPTPAPRCPLEPPPREAPHPGDACTPPLPPPSPPVLTFAPRGAAPDRPAGPHRRRRRQPEPPPRGARHPGNRLRPGPTRAVAASLNPRHVRRRARPTGRPSGAAGGAPRARQGREAGGVRGTGLPPPGGQPPAFSASVSQRSSRSSFSDWRVLSSASSSARRV